MEGPVVTVNLPYLRAQVLAIEASAAALRAELERLERAGQPQAMTPQCRACGSTDLGSFEDGRVIICRACNTDQGA